MPKLKIIPLGKIPKEIMKSVTQQLESVFGIASEVLPARDVPPESYNISRRQFLSDLVLEFLVKNFNGKVLGITDKDLYAEPLNFVFGQAQLNGRAAIISIHHLDQKFYGKSPDKNLLTERSVKEATHEIGHVFGLTHCPDPRCVMCFSNSILDVDGKSKNLCQKCKLKLPDVASLS